MTEQPVKGKVFRMPKEFLVHLSLLGDGPLVAEILVLCKRVEELVTELGISDECIGFVADGDLAIPWKDCFPEEYRSNKSVSHSQVVPGVVLDATRRVRPNSCPGGSPPRQKQGKVTFIRP
jgi:hypothetical protein